MKSIKSLLKYIILSIYSILIVMFCPAAAPITGLYIAAVHKSSIPIVISIAWCGSLIFVLRHLARAEQKNKKVFEDLANTQVVGFTLSCIIMICWTTFGSPL